MTTRRSVANSPITWPFGRVDARDGVRRVVVERGDFRQVAGVGEQHAADNAERRRRDEQGDDAGVAGEADDVVSHIVGSRTSDPSEPSTVVGGVPSVQSS